LLTHSHPKRNKIQPAQSWERRSLGKTLSSFFNSLLLLSAISRLVAVVEAQERLLPSLSPLLAV
jgi:hypothetical protein